MASLPLSDEHVAILEEEDDTEAMKMGEGGTEVPNRTENKGDIEVAGRDQPRS